MRKKLGLAFLFLLLALSLLTSLFFEIPSNLENVMAGPSGAHWLGTDSIGRDVLLRVLQAFGTSFLVGGLGLSAAAFLGLILGGAAAWFGSWVDLLIMRLTDFLDGLPDLLLAIALILTFQSVFSSDQAILVLVLSLALVSWTRLARQTRALVLQEKSKTYATASVSMGASPWRILAFHLWPNIRRPSLRFALMHFPGFILFEGSLSFFGLGLKPPQVSLGILLHEGWRTISLAPHLVWAPAFFLFLTLLCFESLIERR